MGGFASKGNWEASKNDMNPGSIVLPTKKEL